MGRIKMSRMWSMRIAAFLFLFPACLLLAVYVVYATIGAFQLSLVSWNGITTTKDFVGLSNWKDLLADSYFIGAVKHNFFIVIWSLIIQMPIALGLAFMLDRLGRRTNVLKVAYYLPSLFSTAAVGMLFQFLFTSRNGILTTVSKLFGGGIVDILGKSITSLPGVFSVVCWTAIPFYMVFFLAALSGLPEDVYEASIIDGASLSRYFFNIAIPMLKGAFKTAFTLSMIGSLKYFDLIYIMTEGGPNYSSELMATYMYRITFRAREMGYGATIASGMFIFVVVFSLLFLFASNKLLKEDC
jgi:raffinose/stachyose/melibiose transport system permease protein